MVLRLAQQLTPGTLASDGGQRRLLDALYALIDEYPDVRKARAALESAGHDVNTARGARWPTFKVGTNTGDAKLRRGRESYTAVNAEVRMALLEADVALPVVKEFIAKVKERAIGQEVIRFNPYALLKDE